jgi:DNA polymerase IIIc chi subunit
MVLIVIDVISVLCTCMYICIYLKQRKIYQNKKELLQQQKTIILLEKEIDDNKHSQFMRQIQMIDQELSRAKNQERYEKMKQEGRYHENSVICPYCRGEVLLG